MPPPRRADDLPRPDSPGREALVLVSATVLLTLVHFHGWRPGLDATRQIAAWMAINVVALLVVPALLVRVVLREPLPAFGLCLGAPRIWLRDVGLLLLVLAPLAWALTTLPAVRAAYPVHREVLVEPWRWLPVTLGWGAYCLATEFFFRGFLLFGLARLGPRAILVQLVPFVMAHFPKSELEALLAIPAGIVFGVVAWRGRSCLGPWLAHWLVATLVNVLAAR